MISTSVTSNTSFSIQALLMEHLNRQCHRLQGCSTPHCAALEYLRYNNKPYFKHCTWNCTTSCWKVRRLSFHRQWKDPHFSIFLHMSLKQQLWNSRILKSAIILHSTFRKSRPTQSERVSERAEFRVKITYSSRERFWKFKQIATE